MAEREDRTSRTIGDIDLRATPLLAVDLERQLITADPPQSLEDGDGIAARLARVEGLLEADLAALGPSVVTASIEQITARLESLATHVDAVGSRWERAEERLAVQLAVRVKERLDGMEARLDRLTRLVEAATEPVPPGTVTPTDAALREVLVTLGSLAADVAQLTAAARLDAS